MGGWLSVSAIIRLLAELGVDEPAVRSSISRLKRRGILEAERVDGARRLRPVRTGPARSSTRGTGGSSTGARASPRDGWVLAVFRVPESERQKRHMLRSRLAWLGFGTVGPGVWVAPGHLEAETRDVLGAAGARGLVDLFHADYLGFGGVEGEARTWWDLTSINSLYQQFHEHPRPVLAHGGGGGAGTTRGRRSPTTCG